MERFFYGVFAGFLFSSVFYIIGLFVAQSNQKQRWGMKHFFIEFVLIVIAVGVMSWLWGDRFDWIPRYQVPVEYIQIILGVSTGAFTRVWLTRLIADSRIPPQAPPPLPSVDPKAEQATKTPDTHSADWSDRYSWAIGFLVILLIAVLLPYFEDIVKQMSTLKVAGIELTLRTEQKSSYLANLAFTRDNLIATFATVITPDDVGKRLKSDRGMIDDKAKADSRLKADEDYLSLYRDVLFPYLRCMGELVRQGRNIDTVKDDIRVAANELFSIAHADTGEDMIRTSANKLAKFAHNSVKEWSRIERSCKDQQLKEVHVGSRVRESFELYRQLSSIFYFLDDRLGAIQNLERVRNRFQDEMNLPNYLAGLYYVEDPTLTKSAEYYEIALKIAQRNFDSTKARMSGASIVCPDPGKSEVSEPICFDVQRFKNAMILFKSGAAYSYAQSNRRDLARARQLAKEALKEYMEGLLGKNTPSGNTRLSDDEKLWAYIDTYAYVAMAASARSAFPDTNVIACAEKIFDQLAGHASEVFASAMQGSGMQSSNKKGFRTRFTETRFNTQTYTNHRALAASLLANTRNATCSRADENKMLNGDL